jgi:hypothetical protein
MHICVSTNAETMNNLGRTVTTSIFLVEKILLQIETASNLASQNMDYL